MMKMLSVTITWDLTNALVRMDMREMEPTSQVSNKLRYQTMFSQLKKKLTVQPIDVNLAASDKKRSIVSV